ncbi:hypothetical protein CN689_01025 [Peribacillus butanolivorans]|uniref:Uncharacterized protein n=1 Tax=Peribacillus butanolivorans TaxID=421767 RepID=A0AAX0SAL8_9BACI|nr:hypothetical protein [Peribacillus butanolivorans]PEJ37513.1 hypothetical protein CN689_01025 [Peribacillus butanolivorans]
MEENEFLKRINVLYNELIIQDRLKFDGLNYFVKNRQTGKWALAKVLKGDVISAPTSRGTSCPLSNVRFMLENPGPYTLEMLVQLAYEGKLYIYFGWVKGLWTKETRKLYFRLLKESNQPINEHYVKDNHNPFYRSVSKAYSGKQKYRQFLLEMEEDPDEVSGMKNLSVFLNEGRHIESEIINQLKKISAPFEYGTRLINNTIIPDLYNPLTNEVIDIKRHIKTGIRKEIETYKSHFPNVTVLFLLGSRTMEINKLGVRKISIFKWIEEQEFFKNLSIEIQTDILNGFENIVERISLKLAVQDRVDYHKKLVEQIIEYDKLGFNNPQISEKVGITYKYVHSILNGRSLSEYTGNYPEIYKTRQALNKKRRNKELPEKVRILTLGGMKVREVSKRIGISTDMVKYHLHTQDLNEKVIMENRNKRLVELFSTETNHGTLKEKFNWIVLELINEYPHLTFGAVKAYYYSKVYNLNQ